MKVLQKVIGILCNVILSRYGDWNLKELEQLYVFYLLKHKHNMVSACTELKVGKQ